MRRPKIIAALLCVIFLSLLVSIAIAAHELVQIGEEMEKINAELSHP